MTESLPFVSLIVPCRNEEAFIGPCLESILRNDYPESCREILIVDGMSSDRTREIAAAFARRSQGIRLVDNPRVIIPAAMNIGIAESRGEAVLKIDAHSTYPINYVSRCVSQLTASAADNVGGVIVTKPRSADATAQAVALVLAHPLGSGNSVFRIGSKDPRWADTAAFGCYRRDVFTRIGGYNENLVRSSDMDLNTRLRRAGGRILLDPGVTVEYYPVGKLGLFAKRNLLDGFWATYPLRFGGTVLRLRHAVPLICLAVAVAALGLAAVSPRTSTVSVLALAVAYIVAIGVVSARVALRERRIALLPPLLAAFVLRHGAYAIGSLWGLIRAITLKRLFDCIVAAVGLIVTWPILLASAVMIKWHDGGPVFYRGCRIGLDGRPFQMIKFRTMVLDADKLGATSTAGDDPRLTRVGHVLRRYKLDELPQLLNVLKGDMSMVGPRPQVKWAVDLYNQEERRLLSVRPGITDYASIRFSNEAELLRGAIDPDRAYLEQIAPEKIRLGLRYVCEQSLATDIRILIATAWSIIGGTRAAGIQAERR